MNVAAECRTLKHAIDTAREAVTALSSTLPTGLSQPTLDLLELVGIHLEGARRQTEHLEVALQAHGIETAEPP